MVELTHTQKQLKHRHTKKMKLNLARKVGLVKKESGSEEQLQRGRERERVDSAFSSTLYTRHWTGERMAEARK